MIYRRTFKVTLNFYPVFRYKGQFSPSFLCCPETFKWFPIDACRPLLDAQAYARFDPDPASLDDNRILTLSVTKILFCQQVRCWVG